MANIDQTPYDENGNEHGEWLVYFKNHQLMYRWNCFHGLRHGLQEGYYKDGELSLRGYWNMGRKIGYWHLYWEKKYYLCLI